LGLQVARRLLASGQGRTALIAIAQNAAGQAFDQEAAPLFSSPIAVID